MNKLEALQETIIKFLMEDIDKTDKEDVKYQELNRRIRMADDYIDILKKEGLKVYISILLPLSEVKELLGENYDYITNLNKTIGDVILEIKSQNEFNDIVNIIKRKNIVVLVTIKDLSKGIFYSVDDKKLFKGNEDKSINSITDLYSFLNQED